MKKLIIKTLVLLLSLSVFSVKPFYADDDMSEEPVIVETENNNEIVDISEENMEDQEIEIIDDQNENNISQEEEVNLQDENSISINGNEEEKKESSVVKEHPNNSLTTTPGPLTSGSVLHSGNCGANGDNLTYTHYSDYSLVISGTGDMADYDSNNAPWNDWGRGWKNIYSIVISEGVESIGNNAFESFMNVSEPIVFPSTLKKIGSNAFDGCKLLSKVYIPSTVETIGYKAFSGCSETLVLYTNVSDSVNVPAGWDSTWNKNIYWTDVEHVDTYMVSFDTSLDTFNSLTSSWDYNSTTKILTISGNGPMTTYLWDAQPWNSNRSKISQIVIEEGVTIISPAAFMMNSASSVTIPDSVFYIGENAFNMCNLTSVTIPATVTKIGENAFGSDFTESMVVEAGNPTYDSRDNCNAIIETSTNTLINGCKNTVIPSTVTTIAQNAFQNLDSITHFDFPSTVEHIYPNFNGCFGLKKIFVSKETDIIDEFAFGSLSNKEQAVIYTDVEDEGNIPAGWNSDWNSYHDDDYVTQKYTIQYNTTHDEYIDIINHQPVPTDLTIKEDTSGNIIIQTNDTTYLQALAAIQQTNGSPYTRLEIFHDSTVYYAYNSSNPGYGGEHIELVYNASKKNVTLANSYIKNQNIVNGSTQFRLTVEGYEEFNKTITLSHACKSAPAGVTISENANGDILITSSDTNWIKQIKQGGSVNISTDPGFNVYGPYLYGWYNTPEGSFTISNGGKTLTITNEHILNYGITNNIYYLQVSSNGYGVLTYGSPFPITKGAKIVNPESLTITCDQANETIKIISNTDDNDEYMEKLASYYIYNYDTNKTEEYSGQIGLFDTDDDSKWYWLQNMKYIRNSQVDEQIEDLGLSADKKTLTILKDALYRNGIQKNRNYEVNFKVPGYITVTKEITNMEVGVNACPTDIEISEDGEGNIIISSNDLEYLQALAQENDDDNVIAYIDVYTIDENYSLSSDRLANYTWDSDLELDSGEKTITIDVNDIKARNITKGEHEFELYAYGYSKYSENITLEHACDFAPTGVTAAVNTSGDLVITSTNTDWIYQLATYGGVSFISATNGDEYFADAYPEDPFIISNGGKTATITKNKILESNVANGKYTLRLLASGYSRLNITKTISLTKACKPIDASAVNVTYDDVSESIIISSTNKDFLANLCKTYKYYSYSNNSNNKTEEGGYVSFYSDSNDGAWFSNSIEYVDGKQIYVNNSDLVLSTDKLSVSISKDAIYNHALVRDCEYEINIKAAGYQSITINKGEELTFGVSDDLPSMSITFMSNDGNMYISSDDQDWLQGIMYDQSDAGRIEIVDENGECVGVFSNNYYDEPIIESVNNTKIKLSENAIWLYCVATDQYYVHIYSYGYQPFKTNQTQEIKGLRGTPSSINAKLIDDKVIFEYSDNDKTYLEDLADTDSAPIVGGVKSYVAFKQDGDDENGLFYTNQEGDNSIFYDETNEYAYVELSGGKEYLKKHFNNVDDLKIELYVFGYEDNTIDDFEFKFIDEPGPIVLGGKKQLTFSDYDESKVTWESLDEEIAEINDDGVLTAKAIGSTTITATYKEGNVIKSKDNITITVTTNSKVALKLKTTDGNTTGIVDTPEQLELTATGYTLTDKDPIVYTSSDEEIATITNGTITFLKPGIVTVIATAVGGRTATIKLTVYKVDPTKKVTLTYSGGILESGIVISDSLEMLAGGEDLPNGTELTYTTSSIKVATVDANGAITAIGKGTATITVALKDDPAKRKATCKVTVIDRVIYSLDKTKLDVENASGSTLTFTNTAPSTDADSRVILFDFADVNKQTKLHINITDSGVDLNSQNYTPAGVKYTSTDASIAAVDKNGNVTFKKAGLATITVTVTTNPKGMAIVSRDIIFKAINYAPRIETDKFTLNKNMNYAGSAQYPEYNLYAVLNNDVDSGEASCKITNLDDTDSPYFVVDHTGSMTGSLKHFKIKFKDDNAQSSVPAKTYSQYLQFKVNGNWYKYKVSIAVTQTLPSVTPKVTGFYNTFTGENTLELVNTVKNGTISNIEFVDDWATYDSTTGKITGFTQDTNGKLVTSGKVKFTFNGYTSEGYVEKTIKLPTKTTKPTVKLDNSTFTLYVPAGTTGNKTISFILLDNSKNPITSGTVTQTLALNGSTLTGATNNEYTLSGDGTITASIPVNDTLKAGKITLSYKGEGWAESTSIPLTINVKLATALPKAKLSATTVTLDKNFANSAIVAIGIPGSSETINSVDFDDITTGSGDITASYSNGSISITSSVVGTYKVIVTPKLSLGGSSDTPLTPLTLTVKVVDTKPTLKLKTTSVKFNQNYEESTFIDLSLTNNKYNVGIDSIDIPADSPVTGELTSDGKLKLTYNDNGYASGKYKISVTPNYEDVSGNSVNGTPVSLSVELYDKTATAAVTVKNAINPLDASSSSPLTVKLTNLIDNVTSIEINDDYYDDFFKIEDLVLKIQDNADFSTLKDGTYKVNAKVKTSLNTSGFDVVLSAKVARKAPTVKLVTPTINIYDITATGEVRTTDIIIPNGYTIDETNTVFPTTSAYKVEYDKTNSKLKVTLLDGSKVKGASTTSFSIKLIWEGDYTNNGKFTKTSTVKLSVKDMSYSIKAN